MLKFIAYPAGTTVVGIPGKVVEDQHELVIDLEHGVLPDPVAQAIRIVLSRQKQLSERLVRLEQSTNLVSFEEAFKDEEDDLNKWLVREFRDGGGI